MPDFGEVIKNCFTLNVKNVTLKMCEYPHPIQGCFDFVKEFFLVRVYYHPKVNLELSTRLYWWKRSLFLLLTS